VAGQRPQLGGHRRGAPVLGALRRLGQHGGHVGIRPVGGQRQVPGPLVQVGDHSGQMCEQHRAGRGQQPDEGEHGQAHRPRVGWRAVRHGPQQRHVEGVPLRGGQRPEDRVRDRVDQVGQPGERQPALRFAQPALQHPEATPAGPPHRVRPQCRLADTGLALDDGGDRAVRPGGGEVVQRAVERC
jgi:hypothetical protein